MAKVNFLQLALAGAVGAAGGIAQGEVDDREEEGKAIRERARANLKFENAKELAKIQADFAVAQQKNADKRIY